MMTWRWLPRTVQTQQGHQKPQAYSLRKFVTWIRVQAQGPAAACVRPGTNQKVRVGQGSIIAGTYVILSFPALTKKSFQRPHQIGSAFQSMVWGSSDSNMSTS
jgi:hypothetical protein